MLKITIEWEDKSISSEIKVLSFTPPEVMLANAALIAQKLQSKKGYNKIVTSLAAAIKESYE